MIGDLEKSSFSNIEQQSLEFVKYTLDPWVIRWEQSLQKALLLPGEKGKYFIKLNVDGLLRGINAKIIMADQISFKEYTDPFKGSK